MLISRLLRKTASSEGTRVTVYKERWYFKKLLYGSQLLRIGALTILNSNESGLSPHHLLRSLQQTFQSAPLMSLQQ